MIPGRRIPPLAALLLALLLSPPPAQASTTALPKGVQAGPSIEGISEYTLANGLRVLLFPDSTRPTVTVNVVYRVGSVHEPHGQSGMAHLLEHLLYKGTPDHPDIAGEMKRRGISYNATTGLERTHYYATFPADGGTLDWVLRMEADRMFNARLDRTDLDSEMTVVRNELESGESNAGSVLVRHVRRTAYRWHRYGQPTIGARTDVEAADIENLQAFYRTWYRPDNATVVVAGQIEPADVLRRIQATFGRLRAPATPLQRSRTIEPAQQGEREVTVRRAGDLRMALVSYHIPARTHPDNAALQVLADVLGHSPGGRLHKALVETRIAAVAGAGAEDEAEPGLFSALMAQSRDGDAARAEAVLLAQLEELAREPVTAEEVEQAKQRLANAHDLHFTDVEAVALGLTEHIAAGDWRLLFTSRDAIAAVSVDDVNRVAATYLRRENRTLGRFVPTDEPQRVAVPAAPPATAVVAGYSGRPALDAGEHLEPTPGNLEARTQRFTLGDGLKVALLPKRTRGGVVVVDAYFRFGDAESLAGRQDAAGMAGAMLMRGARGLDRRAIDLRLEELQARVDISGGLQGVGLALVGRRGKLEETLDLVAVLLREPTFPEEEFEQLRLLTITGLEASRIDPDAVVYRTTALHFDPWPEGHPLHVRTLDESLAAVRALRRDDVVAFHRDFYGTAQGEIAIVGDFDPDAVRAQLERLFAGWRSPRPYRPIAKRHTDVAPVRQRLSTPDKPNGVLLARQNVALRVTDPDYPALVVANRIFGDGPLKSRLGDRIRQKEGLSYGVKSWVDADDSIDGTDDAGNMAIWAMAEPGNMEQVEAALREELQRLVSGGITEAELRDAVSGLLAEREQARADDHSVAGILQDQLYHGRTMAFIEARDAAYRALTVDQVNAAIARHLAPDRLSVFVAGDFDAAGGDAARAAPARAD